MTPKATASIILLIATYILSILCLDETFRKEYAPFFASFIIPALFFIHFNLFTKWQSKYAKPNAAEQNCGSDSPDRQDPAKPCPRFS